MAETESADGARPTSQEYDEIPYPSGPIRHTHPCHLATLPRLFGIQSAPPNQARVLELGCAAGGNLMPMAESLPGSRFVGIDLSARQIDDGLSVLNRVPADNLSLQHRSIADISPELGNFDYIICHGVYSWVPRPIQDKILEIGRKQLTKNGILYVSYNTQPGWSLRGVVRDMMQYHAAPFETPAQQISQARSLLRFLVESADSNSEAYRTLLRDEAQILARQTDSYLFHEHLEDVNEALYFSEFLKRSESAGLRYLGESEFPMMLPENFDEATSAILSEAPFHRQEQYMDFLRARTFRCTLLCHHELQPDREVDASRMSEFHLAIAEPIDLKGCDLNSQETVERAVLGGTISTNSPVTKQALARLSDAFPAAIEMEALTDLALSATPGRGPMVRQALHADLLAMFGKGVLLAAVDPPRFTTQRNSRPTATPLARDQAAHNLPITNRRHVNVQLDFISNWTLKYLNGERAASHLVTLLRSAMAAGDLEITNEHSQPVTKVTDKLAADIIDHALKTLAENALLIA